MLFSWLPGGDFYMDATVAISMQDAFVAMFNFMLSALITLVTSEPGIYLFTCILSLFVLKFFIELMTIHNI